MDIHERIYAAGEEEIGEILDSALFRYRQLYPDWEISVISIEKSVDKNRQLDETIRLLENMKEK